MKISVAYESETASAETYGRKVMIWPDSAMILSGKPVFLPDYDNHVIMPAIGARIDAVGKTILPKFAPRYFSKLLPLILILREDVAKDIVSRHDPAACDIIADYTVVAGLPFDTDSNEDRAMINISLEPLAREGEAENHRIEVTDLKIKMAEAVSSASVRNTIKTGDIVAFAVPAYIHAEEETRLRLDMENQNALIETKLK